MSCMNLVVSILTEFHTRDIFVVRVQRRVVPPTRLVNEVESYSVEWGIVYV